MTNILWIHFATDNIPRAQVTESLRVSSLFSCADFLQNQNFSLYLACIFLRLIIHLVKIIFTVKKGPNQCGDAFYCSHQFSCSLFVGSTFLAPAYSAGRTWVALIQASKQAELNWDTEKVCQDSNKETKVHMCNVCMYTMAKLYRIQLPHK